MLRLLERCLLGSSLTKLSVMQIEQADLIANVKAKMAQRPQRHADVSTPALLEPNFNRQFFPIGKCDWSLRDAALALAAHAQALSSNVC